MAEIEITKTKLTAGIFILLAIVGTVYYVGIDDTAYYCQDTNLVGLCWDLSQKNDLGTQTRCYYNESAPTRYKTCKIGWEKYKGEIIGEPIDVSDEVEFDLNLSFDKKSTLKKIGIGKIEIKNYTNENKTEWNVIGYDNPKITPCIKQDDFICISKIYQKNEIGGINKDIKVVYKSCINWTNNTEEAEDFITECIEWKVLNQEEIEVELINQANKMLSEIASIQESREAKIKNKLTRDIILEIN